MIGRISGAAARAFLVGLLVATPSLLLPGVSTDTTQIVTFLIILAAGLTFVEYNSNFPSIVEFRDAPPFNRIRFAALFITVFALTAIAKGTYEPTTMTQMLTSIGTILGNAIDFPYSPVRLVVLMLPVDASPELVASVRIAAGISYLVSVTALAIFVLMVRVLGWPTRNGAFNVWTNLPLFDPTAGGDVLFRLQRDSRINITLGFLLPFFIPAVVKMASDMIDPISLANPSTLIWTMTAWAFLPASMIMRGIAMGRVADMIEQKRKRAYADAQTLQPA